MKQSAATLAFWREFITSAFFECADFAGAFGKRQVPRLQKGWPLHKAVPSDARQVSDLPKRTPIPKVVATDARQVSDLAKRLAFS